MKRNLLLLMLFIGLAMACSKSKSKKGGDGGVNSKTQPDLSPRGKFTELGVYENPNSISFREFCTPDQPQRLSPRLASQQSYLYENIWRDDAGNYVGGPIRDTFLEVDLDAGTLRRKREVSLPWSASATYIHNCTFWDNHVGCSLVSEEAPPKPENWQDIEHKNPACGLAFPNPEKSLKRVSYGTYTFANGKTVDAIRIETAEFGLIRCQGSEGLIEAGTGQRGEDRIVSYDIPDLERLSACGNPTTIYEHNQTLGSDGKLLREGKTEVIEVTP